MNATESYARLLAAGVPVLQTSEAAALLGTSPMTAAQALRRLARTGLIRPLRHGLVWLSRDPIDPWVALDYLAAPYPAYASLYSALSLHGVLSQLPAVHYAVTLGRTHRFETDAGTYSLHRVAPELFGGFETSSSGAKVATVEKALFDLAYLAPTRSSRFRRPPELELPRRLSHKELARWTSRVRAVRRRTQVERALAILTGQHHP